MRTERKVSRAVAKGVVALIFVLAAGAAQSQTVILDPADSTQAIGIDDLVVDATTYDVDFSAKTNPQSVYGDFPGVLDFDDVTSAGNAMDSVDLALNGAAGPPLRVGAAGSGGDDKYIIGFGTETVLGIDNLVHLASNRDGTGWERLPGQDSTMWRAVVPTTRVIATFTEVPEPGATLSLLVALATLGGIAG